MGSRDVVRAVKLPLLLEKSVALATSPVLDAVATTGASRIAPAMRERDVELRGQCSRSLCASFRVRIEAVVKVGRDQGDISSLAQTRQAPEQGGGIGSAGEGDDQSSPRFERRHVAKEAIELVGQCGGSAHIRRKWWR